MKQKIFSNKKGIAGFSVGALALGAPVAIAAGVVSSNSQSNQPLAVATSNISPLTHLPQGEELGQAIRQVKSGLKNFYYGIDLKTKRPDGIVVKPSAARDLAQGMLVLGDYLLLTIVATDNNNVSTATRITRDFVAQDFASVEALSTKFVSGINFTSLAPILNLDATKTYQFKVQASSFGPKAGFTPYTGFIEDSLVFASEFIAPIVKVTEPTPVPTHVLPVGYDLARALARVKFGVTRIYLLDSSDIPKYIGVGVHPGHSSSFAQGIIELGDYLSLRIIATDEDNNSFSTSLTQNFTSADFASIEALSRKFSHVVNFAKILKLPLGKTYTFRVTASFLGPKALVEPYTDIEEDTGVFARSGTLVDAIIAFNS